MPGYQVVGPPDPPRDEPVDLDVVDPADALKVPHGRQRPLALVDEASGSPPADHRPDRPVRPLLGLGRGAGQRRVGLPAGPWARGCSRSRPVPRPPGGWWTSTSSDGTPPTRPFLSRSSGSDATSGLGRTPVEMMIVRGGDRLAGSAIPARGVALCWRRRREVHAARVDGVHPGAQAHSSTRSASSAEVVVLEFRDEVV